VTRVCLVGEDDVNLQYELLSRETAREALATYEPGAPYENTLAVETVSLGAAVALLNDLDWYLARFVRAAFVREPSVHPAEYLSRELATAVRDGDVAPGEAGDLLMVYGVDDGRLVEPMYVRRSDGTGSDTPTPDAGSDTAPTPDTAETASVTPGTPSVERETVEPGDDEGGDREGNDGGGGGVEGDDREDDDGADARTRPSYDLREVEDTVVVRVTEDEFAG